MNDINENRPDTSALHRIADYMAAQASGPTEASALIRYAANWIEAAARLASVDGPSTADLALLAEAMTPEGMLAVRAELDRLRHWKSSAIDVLAEWDLVFDALGRPGQLGEFKSRASLAEVTRLALLAAADRGGKA